jgi:hypothetical protein
MIVIERRAAPTTRYFPSAKIRGGADKGISGAHPIFFFK